jgi:hypothetical protein
MKMNRLIPMLPVTSLAASVEFYEKRRCAVAGSKSQTWT